MQLMTVYCQILCEISNRFDTNIVRLRVHIGATMCEDTLNIIRGVQDYMHIRAFVNIYHLCVYPTL